MEKYITRWGNTIEMVEVMRESEHSVWLRGGKRQKKHSSWRSYFDSWEEAHGYILERAERKVNSIKLRLNSAQGELGNIKGLKPK